MKIPKRFKLLGQTIEIVYTPEKFIENTDRLGFASFRKNQVQLRPSTDVFPLTKDQIEETFCHELVHFLTYHAGAAYSGKADYMHQDEEFINLLGGLLHQALTTMEFD